MLKNLSRSLLPVLVLIVLGFGAIFGIRYLQYRNSPEYQALQEMKRIEKAYANDTYGGETPEETLRLFIDALKKGDTDLATKYFVLDVQPEWKESLKTIKEKGLLETMIADLEKSTRGNDITQDSVRFVVANSKNEVITIINIAKNVNGKWKLLNF